MSSHGRFDFDEVFDDDYLYFYEPLLDEASDAGAETIWRLLELEPGMEVLDLACGHGRIANRLAGRGARVTGLDATPLFLERARRGAKTLGARASIPRPAARPPNASSSATGAPVASPSRCGCSSPSSCAIGCSKPASTPSSFSTERGIR